MNSQLKYNKNNMKETLIFCSHRAETSENKTQNFILQRVRLQHKLDLPALQLSTIKVRALGEQNVILKVGMGMCGKTLISV